MSNIFAVDLDLLEVDSWRVDHPFSDNMRAASEALYASATDEAASEILSDWLTKHQPCLFGRIAAKAGLIQFCILRENDLLGDEALLQNKIQEARLEWTANGFKGLKSAFVILIVSRRLSEALPSAAINSIAKKLTGLYLQKEAENDVIYHDNMFLEKPDTRRSTWQWLAGINYFSAHADGRWWQDHRIPGGLALSINSVGHMVKSGQLNKVAEYADLILGGEPDNLGNDRLDSLQKALDLAMRTINMASDAVSGKATYLHEYSSPAELDLVRDGLNKNLVKYNHAEYTGWYHTDVTLPSIYFREDVTRPDDIPNVLLDFSYLYDSNINNPDYILMGTGRRIRSGEAVKPVDSTSRLQKAIPTSMPISDYPFLVDALSKIRSNAAGKK